MSIYVYIFTNNIHVAHRSLYVYTRKRIYIYSAKWRTNIYASTMCRTCNRVYSVIICYLKTTTKIFCIWTI